MEIVYALLLGMAIGCAWVFAALVLLFSMLQRCDAKGAAAVAAGADPQAVNRQAMNSVLKFHVGKYILDVLLLLALFLLRNWLPFPWQYVLLAVAMMMTIVFQLVLAFTGVNKRLLGRR